MPGTFNLQIVVDPSCENCQQALSMATWVRRNYPEASIRVIDLSLEGSEKPEAVFAVPTYLLDGKPVFLGNPSREALRVKLDRYLT